MKIISEWKKPASRWVFREDDRQSGWSKEKVRLADHEKMVMAIVEVKGKLVTRHMIV